MPSMIVRVTSDQLRNLADQIDGYTRIMRAKGTVENLAGPLYVKGEPIAYLHWWEDQRTFLCEFLDFKPGG